MSPQEFISAVITGYKDILLMCLPITFTIGACNLAFNIISSAFFTGHISFVRGGRK